MTLSSPWSHQLERRWDNTIDKQKMTQWRWDTRQVTHKEWHRRGDTTEVKSQRLCCAKSDTGFDLTDKVISQTKCTTGEQHTGPLGDFKVRTKIGFSLFLKFTVVSPQALLGINSYHTRRKFGGKEGKVKIQLPVLALALTSVIQAPD